MAIDKRISALPRTNLLRADDFILATQGGVRKEILSGFVGRGERVSNEGYPLAVGAGDVTASIDLSSDTYAALIARWDAAFTDGDGKYNLTVNKVSMSPTTTNGNTIFAYVFTPTTPTHTIVLTSCIHGDERESPAVFLEVAKLYFNQPDVSSPFNQVRNDTRLVFVPVVNPDGYDLDQRTNAAATPVDINRNWDSNGTWSDAWENWATGGDEYKGASAFSEGETQALKSLIEGYGDCTAVIDCHAYGAGVDVDCNITPARSNDPEPSTVCVWAALEAFGSGIKFTCKSGTTEPPPWFINWAQGEGLWATVLELGTANQDITVVADMATLVNWIGSTIIGVGKLPTVTYVQTTTPKTYHMSEGQTINLGSGTSYVELTEFTVEIPVDFVGIAIAQYSLVCYPGSDTGDILFFAPLLGQNIDTFSESDATNILGEERYVNGGTSKRATVAMTASRMVFPSERNTAVEGIDTLTWGVQYKNGNAPTGTPVLYRYASTLTLIPSVGGNTVNMYTVVASSPSLRFP